MKIKITREGALEIERAGKFKAQLCPYDNPAGIVRGTANCGDWCPKFQEPGADNDHLHVCGDIVLMPTGKIIDERERSDDK